MAPPSVGVATPMNIVPSTRKMSDNGGTITKVTCCARCDSSRHPVILLTIQLSTATANADFRVALWWLVLTYFLHSIAELCISPVGLSMITKLSIARVVGMMMGVWFLSISIGEYLAGAAAQAASVQTVGGEVTNPQLALQTYAHTFMVGGETTMVAGVILLAISPWLRKIMHGVK